MSYSLQHIASILSVPSAPLDVEIRILLTDSRKLTDTEYTLFFALDGPRRNGHLFIEDLYQKGVRYFVVSQNIDQHLYPEAIFLKVKNCLEALQLIAASRRKQFNIDVIGITGSNGKTVVKEWLYQLLQTDINIVRSPKSYNSQIGVPLSVWQLNEQNELAIFEAGISQQGEMEKLEAIIKPTIGVLTNIGSAHSEGFIDDEQKLQEKLKLFTHSKVLISDGDNLLLQKNLPEDLQFFSYGTKENNAVQVLAINRHTTSTNIVLKHENLTVKVQIPFTDKASIENVITCCTVLFYLKINPGNIEERIKKLHAINMRLEFKNGINNCLIINDSYSADVNSLSIALDFLQQQAKGLKKTVILSDFADSKINNDDFYTGIIKLLQQYHIHRFIGIGSKMTTLLAEALLKANNQLEVSLYLNTKDFIKQFQSSRFKDEVILIKGSRTFQFEHIVALFEQKVHQTILEINLDAIAHNYKMFQQLLKPTTKMMVMVKAFAYGSGGIEVASVLQYHKADYFGVAYADEGVELRAGGITTPIMVLNVDDNAFDAITENNLEPDIFTFEMLAAFTQHVKDNGLKNYPIHIEVETGMNRLGFNVADMIVLGEKLHNNEYIKVMSVFSHLAASDDGTEDDFSLHQYHLLKEAAIILKKKLDYYFLCHITNSSGIVRLPQLQMDMVRLGIGLYGAGDTTGNLRLQPALTLKSTIAQIKHIKKGDTVSYNRRGIAQRDSVIATVRIGYADGYSRKFSNGVGFMLVNDKPAPVIGTVCMDMTMIDITEITGVQEGDAVIVFGIGMPVEELAKKAGTIPYEIMTSISQRVKRVYWSE
ncbi:MAG: bifunctional UDP-N-acetylmuramoyl-tripeptide:D-alanyl-D-alanine ligase/alanine racemase [Niabella sp.]